MLIANVYSVSVSKYIHSQRNKYGTGGKKEKYVLSVLNPLLPIYNDNYSYRIIKISFFNKKGTSKIFY